MPTVAANTKSSPPPAPDVTSLRAAALAYLARFAATEAGLTRMLERKVDRWARTTPQDRDNSEAEAAQARRLIPDIVRDLADTGALSDAIFAQTRARALARAGRSRRAIASHLAMRGVPAPLAAEASPMVADQDYVAALIHARKRRIGPWRKQADSVDLLRRELGSLARAGFAHDIAFRALQADRETAETAIIAFRAAL